MVNFKISLTKSPQGEIVVNGNYVSGNDPVVVERVNVVELDSAGNTIGATTYRLNKSIDPSPGNYLLVSQTPSGSNVKAARATACYYLIDKTAQSTTLNL
jgi:cystathionine beta-lyase family protein involved in aluminum resistance